MTWTHFPCYLCDGMPWCHHQMETFFALLAICAGNSPVTGEFPAQRPVTRSFDIFFDLRLDEGLSKQTWGWWFETPSRPLWRHCNANCHMWNPLISKWLVIRNCIFFVSLNKLLSKSGIVGGWRVTFLWRHCNTFTKHPQKSCLTIHYHNFAGICLYL